MPDTYSTDGVGVLLMATGGDSGTWGSNLNANALQYLVDGICNVLSESVTGGTLDLSGSPPPTASSQSRFGLISFTGALTSAQTVKIPALPKIWLVQNNTSGAFTLKIQTPTLGTAATINQSSSWQWVVCEGTSNNVYAMPMDFAGTFTGTLTTSGFTCSASTISINSHTLGLTANLTLAGAAGKTLTVNNSIALAGVDNKQLNLNNTMTLAAGFDGNTWTFPAASDTVACLGTAQSFSVKQTFLFSNGTTHSINCAAAVGYPGGATSIGIGVKTLNDLAGNTFIAFYGSTDALAGGITSVSATSVNYVTSSDYRIKYDFADSNYGLNDLLKIKVQKFRFRDDPGRGFVDGLLAQDIARVYPDAVSRGEDDGEAPLKEGERPWGVDYGRLTPMLIRAIQQLAARVAQLEARAPL